ncbi:MAG TPA: hypothetical protein VFW24_14525 [Acidimicrobiales bacterium]|nr:hypothetical protein [Acidimicrobiales bacterium]
MPESVVIVDGNLSSAQLVRDALGRDGRFPLVELAPTARAAIEVAARLQPVLIVFHVALGELAMSDALRMVHAAAPGSRVVVLPGSRPQGPGTEGATAGRSGREDLPGSESPSLMP